MSITPEQFKDIIAETVNDQLADINTKIAKNHNEVMNTMDVLVKKYEDHETEHAANLDAHDRMQNEINECRQKMGMKVIPV